MATTIINFTFQNADIAAVIPSLCAYAGLPESPANAKQSITIFIQRNYQEWLKNQGLKTLEDQAIQNAQTTAQAVIIT